MLPRLYGQIILPESVHWELLDEGGSGRVGQWARSLPPWIAIRRAAGTAMQPATRLHRGEADAIALAEELNASLVLMDDAAGVRFALARGLTITGTLGILVKAAQHGLVGIDAALDRLKMTDFRAAPQLYDRARQLASAKPPVPPRRNAG